jgi:hypothetical protein
MLTISQLACYAGVMVRTGRHDHANGAAAGAAEGQDFST